MTPSTRPVSNPSGLPDDGDLLAGPDPDGRRFAVFYRRHVDAVLAFLAQQGVDAWTAADVAAETFAAAVVARGKFDPTRGEARAWILGIARNKLADSRRRWVRDRRLQQRLGMERIALSHDDIEAYERLRDARAGDAVAALDSLPGHQRDALRARVIAGKPYSEISRELGVTEATSRQHVRRGLDALRRLLAGGSG